MRRQQLALLISSGWALVLAGVGLALLVGGPVPALVGGIAGGALASGLGLAVARWAERGESQKLQALGQAVGLAAEEGGSVEAVARSLLGQLDRGRTFRLALQELTHPALLLDGRGNVLAASRGLEALLPDLGDDTKAALAAGRPGDLMISDGMVMLSGRRFRMDRSDLPGDRVLVELMPAGHHIREDDFEGFVQALSHGRTGFRFDDWGQQHDPALRALGGALDSLDRGFRVLEQMFKGQAVDTGLLFGNSGFAAQVRLYKDAFDQILAERDMALEARAGLQAKLDAIMGAIDRYRDSVTALAELADRSRTGLAAASLAMGKSRDRAFGLQQLEKEAIALAADAALAAERNLRAVSGLNDSARAIEKAVSMLEDASHRTSVVALNAAVEAARIGDKAATFSLLAGEVRNLAQQSQRSVREIRMLITASRSGIGASNGESSALQKAIKDLGLRLHNISTDTDMISGTLAEGSGTMARLDSHFGAVGSEAAKALLFPRQGDSSNAA